MEIYPHNELAYNKAIAAITKDNNCALVQPTGTGKSFIAAKYIAERQGDKILFISSSHYILNQFKAHFKQYIDNVKFTIYHALHSYNEHDLKGFDHIILDEFHRAGAQTWQSYVEGVLANNPQAKILGLTATHLRFLEDNRNMALELFGKEPDYHLSLPESFDLGILPVPKYITALINIDREYERLKSLIQKSNHKKKTYLLKRVVENKLHWELSNGVEGILKKHITSERNFIVFCTDTNHLQQMLPTVVGWFQNFPAKINTYITHSFYSDSTKELEDFCCAVALKNGNFNLIFCVDQLNEGIHIPQVDGLIFLRPTMSGNVYFQQLGRCLSTKGKQPLVFDFVSNFKNGTAWQQFHNYEYNKVITQKYLINHYEKYRFAFTVVDETLQIRNLFDDYKRIFGANGQWLRAFDVLENTLKNDTKYQRSSSKFVRYNQKIKDKLSTTQIELLEGLKQYHFDWELSKEENNIYKWISWAKTLDNPSYKLMSQKRKRLLAFKYSSLRRSYKEGKLDTSIEALANELASLINYGDWKHPKRITFSEYCQLIEQAIDQKKKLSHKIRVWISYKRRHPKTLTTPQRERLNSLLLGFKIEPV